jgi:transcriptional regulator with XRE-family HTH domain
MNMQETGLYIRKLRKEKGLTQQELAERVFVSTQAVSKWETGDSFPDVESLEKIAQVFCVTVDEIIKANTKDKVMVFEFGLGILPYVSAGSENSLMSKVKELRKSVEFPKIRFLDNASLKNEQYRLIIDDVVLVDNSLTFTKEEDRVNEMLSYIKLNLK